jgi:hypothetical protein
MRCRVMLATMLCLTLVGCVVETEELEAPSPTESLGQGLREQESRQTEVTQPEPTLEPTAAPGDPSDRPSVQERRARPDPCPWRVDPTSSTIDQSNAR